MSEPPLLNRHEKNHFDHISQWFPALGTEHTFDTELLPLHETEGTALCKVREYGRMIGHMWSWAQTEEEKQRAVQMDPVQMLLKEQPELHAALLNLSSRLDSVLQRYPEGAFVRMNTRSPKDAVLRSALVKQLITESIEASPQEDVNSLECAIADSIIYWSCVSKACRVRTGEEAVELLYSSNRVQQDLKLGFLEHGESVPVVIREWEDIHPEYEYRVFVVQKKITAISQYHAALYVPTMVENKETVIRLILEEFDRVKEKIEAPEDTYTIDFVINEDLKGVRVIEINDPPPIAGTSLFDWEKEEDRRIVQQGPLTCRMIEEPIPWIEQQSIASMHPPLVELIDVLRGRKSKSNQEDISREESSAGDQGKCILQ